MSAHLGAQCIHMVSRKIVRRAALMGQMPAAFCPATFKNFAASYRALTSEEAMLSFALPLGWLVLSSACAMAGLDHDRASRRGWRGNEWQRAKKSRSREREEMNE